MRRLIVLILITLTQMNVQAQNNHNQIAGTYFLKNVRETGAGFRIPKHVILDFQT